MLDIKRIRENLEDIIVQKAVHSGLSISYAKQIIFRILSCV